MNSTLGYFKSNSESRHVKILQDNVAEVKTKNGIVNVYFPDSSEYIVTEDVVLSAEKVSCKLITYATTWGSKTEEADLLAEKKGMKIIPLGALFKISK